MSFTQNPDLNNLNDDLNFEFTENMSNPDELNVDEVEEKLSGKKKGKLKKVWGDVNNIVSVLKSDQTTWKEKATAITALAYVISPIDAIPDAILGLGLSDDAAVVVAAVASLALAVQRINASNNVTDLAKAELNAQVNNHIETEKNQTNITLKKIEQQTTIEQENAKTSRVQIKENALNIRIFFISSISVILFLCVLFVTYVLLSQ